MPRRKRATAQNERQRKVRRTDNDEDTLVISDSENEEEEDSTISLSPRACRWRERGSRVQLQDMTEDEMLDLAMRLSKQEAAQRKQEDDDVMRKAIAESLHVSHSQDPEAESEPISPMPKPHEDPHTVTGPLRRKLCFPDKKEMHSATSGEPAPVDGVQDANPLPLMPDLSQRTLSQSESLCPDLPSVPSTSSQQECPSSQWKDGVHDADPPKDERLPRDSHLHCSPAFLQQGSVHLGQDMLRPSGGTHDSSSPDLNRPHNFQLTLPSSPPKSHVFVTTEPKGGNELSGNKVSDSFTDNLCSPNTKEEENCQESSSHKILLCESRDCHKRLSLCSKAQSLTRISVPDGNDGGGHVGVKQEDVQPNRMKDKPTHGPSLDPVFEKAAKSEEPLPEETFQEFTSHMVLKLSDDDDEEKDKIFQVVVPSPVFCEASVSRAHPPNLSPTQPSCSLLATTTTIHTLSQESNSQDVLQRKIIPKTTNPADSHQPKALRKWIVQDTPACDSRFTEGKGEGLVSYYWGVPFCPRGQNPDDYTGVILSQLEVYEKSLKAAQRELLHKVDWGIPVSPCPLERSFSRRFKRHRAPRPLDEEDGEDGEEPEQRQQEEEKKTEDVGEERAESRAGSDVGAGNGPSEPYVVVSSPEVQEELAQKSHFLQQESMDAFKPSKHWKPSPRDRSPIQQRDEYEDQNTQCDVESIVCPETQLTEDSPPELMVTSPVQPQSRADSEVMEVDEEGGAPAADEDRMEQGGGEEEHETWQEPLSPQSRTVACPMCSQLFTRSKIEMHAAYCDGATEPHEQRVSARRKKTGRIGEASPRSQKSEEQEKCYSCCKFFSSKEYIQHVTQCLQQKQSRQGNGLLAALDKTEKGHIDDYGAGPSDTTIRNNRGLADPSVMAEAGGSGSSSESNFIVSSSPIKSFTPISEATDCLIDFKDQYSARHSQRLGRKRKFKR